jgi:hypothetical protein
MASSMRNVFLPRATSRPRSQASRLRDTAAQPVLAREKEDIAVRASSDALARIKQILPFFCDERAGRAGERVRLGDTFISLLPCACAPRQLDVIGTSEVVLSLVRTKFVMSHRLQLGLGVRRTPPVVACRILNRNLSGQIARAHNTYMEREAREIRHKSC